MKNQSVTIVQMFIDSFAGGAKVASAVLMLVGVALATMAVQTLPAEAAEDKIRVSVEGGKLSVVAVNARVEDVVAGIGREVGVRVRRGRDLERRVTLAFSGEGVESGLRRILGAASWAMIYQADANGGPRRLTEVWIYGPAGNAASIEITHPSPAAGTEDGVASAADADLNNLHERMTLDKDAEARIFAAWRLARQHGRAGAAALADGMRDPEPLVRREVVRALGEVGGDDATMALGQTVFGDEDAEVRLAAVNALTDLSGARARTFVDAATGDGDPRVANAAREALQRMP